MSKLKRLGIAFLIITMMTSQMSAIAFAEDGTVPEESNQVVEESMDIQSEADETATPEEDEMVVEEDADIESESDVVSAKEDGDDTDSAADSTPADREEISLNGTWSFVNPSGQTEEVQVPHSWDHYFEGAMAFMLVKECTYTRTVDVSEFADKAKVLKFDGVNKVAVVYVDGKKIATHKGGFSTFDVDITKQCEGKDSIELKVAVSNLDMKLNGMQVSDSTMPIDTDFTHFAGIYRDVTLVTLNKNIHLSTNDYGSDGVYLDYELDHANKTVELAPTVMLDYDFDEATDVTLKTEVFDADGNPVKDASVKREMSGSRTARCTDAPAIKMNDVHLWQGTDDPYLYTVKTSVMIGEDVVDSNIQKVGFRNFKVSNGKFYLNGKVYTLHGVGMHQEINAQTNVRTKESLESDIDAVLEMGANALRTAHYPHSQYIYELCDEAGIVVWNEIPFYLLMLETDNFKQNTMDCATEMVKQGYNHPSIIVWGLNNEVNYNEGYDKYYSTQATSEQLIAYMKQLAKHVYSIDSTRMIGSAAINNSEKIKEVASWYTGNSKYTTVGFNIYGGWYSRIDGATTDNQNKIKNGVVSNVKRFEALFDSDTNFVMTEYGAGANVAHHADMDGNFKWATKVEEPEEGFHYTYQDFHPEEYQSYVHEADIRALYGDKTKGEAKVPGMWAAFAWCMFDFSNYRNEGGIPRLNTKGLITADRQTKKDAFYLYKANWNKTDYFVHINSSRYVDRTSRVTSVRVYSNCDSVELTVNGYSYGKGTKVQDGVFVWKKVALAHSGEANSIVATGAKNGQTYTDQVDEWVYNAPSAEDEEYVIWYKLKGGKNNANNKDVYATGKGAKLYKPTKKGYTFVGWYTDKACTKKITAIAAGKKADIDLYAKWKANRYTIRFKGNGATSGKMKSTKATYNKTKVLPVNKFERKGYKFVGWSTKKSGKAKIYKNKARVKNLKASGTVTLYARWKKK